MARTYSAVVTATGNNIAFQIEVSNIGTIVLERSINGKVYAKDGSVTPFGGIVGTGAKAAELYIARRNTAFTQMGFHQLLIFNKELSQAEVNDVLRAMFPA